MAEQITPADEAAAAATVPSAPAFSIVNADATPEEIAALVAVFSAMGGGAAPAPKPRREWNTPQRAVRRELRHGLGGWRASAAPR